MFSILRQPKDTKGALGDYVKLNVVVWGGTAPLKYQWQYAKAGETTFTNSKAKGNTTDVLEPPVEQQAYDYRCIVIDSDGEAITSKTARVQVGNVIKITNQLPEYFCKLEKELYPNTEFTIKAEYKGGPVKYQWQESIDGKKTWIDLKDDGNNIVGAKTEKLNYNGLKNTFRDLRCVVSADDQQVISSPVRAFLDIESIGENRKSPAILYSFGDKVEFRKWHIKVNAVEEPGDTLKYQWYTEIGKVTDGVLTSNEYICTGANTNFLKIRYQGSNDGVLYGPTFFWCVVTSEKDGTQAKSNYHRIG